MNIVYIIGNGFDVSVEMKTRYTDFYDDYCQRGNEEQNPYMVKVLPDVDFWIKRVIGSA